MVKIHCDLDGCDAAGPENDLCNWVKTEPFGEVTFSVLGGDHRERHFCSVAHAASALALLADQQRTR